MRDLETRVRRVQRANNILLFAVPLWFLGLVAFSAVRREWGWAVYYLGLLVGLIIFRVWLDRRMKRRLAERQRMIDEMMARFQDADRAATVRGGDGKPPL